jgi:CelD/BcsL family acetyltransferase involved in cellulose biosynthesis
VIPTGVGTTARMSADIVSEWSALAPLEAEWNGLLGRSRADTIFLRWEWIRAWQEVAGEWIRPFAVIVRDSAGTLAGIAPFYLTEYRLGRLVPYRVLRVMADYATGAEYPDWIVRTDCETRAAQAIAAALGEARARWDCIWMPNVAGWTGALERIVEACRQERFSYHVRPQSFGVVDLPDSTEAYIKALSLKTRQNLQTEMKRVRKRCGITMSRCESSGQLPRFLEALFDLHHRRWKERGEEGTFRRKPNEAHFYRRFAPVALQKGWLWLSGLEEDGDLKAVQIGYVYDGVFHSMQEGFDPSYIKGVGNVLRAKIIEACIGTGLKAYDFLGEMSDHKRRWLAQERTGHDLFIGHGSLKNRMLFGREIWPTGRFLRPTGQTAGAGR